MRKKTDQELFWEGNFGDAYSDRSQNMADDRRPFFSRVLEYTGTISSVCELGANVGENLRAIASLQSGVALTGVEINRKALQKLSTIPGLQAVCSSIQDFDTSARFDLVFTSGVLIHVAPPDLPLVYDKMFEISERYVLMNEYFNPTPVEVVYRDQHEKLFKRDFSGEFLDRFPDRLSVLAYGFLWKRLEPAWDNTTWTLFEKTGGSKRP